MIRALQLSLALTLLACTAETQPASADEEYELELIREQTDAIVALARADSEHYPTIVGLVEDGRSVETTFGPDARYLAILFDTTEGTSVTLRISTTDATMYPLLFVYRAAADGRPYGHVVAWESHAAPLTFTPEYTSTYVALVRRRDLGASGTFTLSMNVDAPSDRSCTGGCEEGEYCRLGPMCGAGEGVCAEKPEVCPFIHQPVCGCDAQTYPNACVAASEGVSVAREGACVRPCGGESGARCAAGELCQLDLSASCDSNASGVCIPFPEACPDIEAPVCGCDGRSYANDCLAHMSNANVYYLGECDHICGDNGDCDERSFCMQEPATACGRSDVLGVCTPRPTGCATQVEIVCGCDGVTYANRCSAYSEGASIAHAGRC